MPLVFLALLSFTLWAQENDPRKDKTHPCFMDFPLFCKEEVPGEHNAWNCLGQKFHVLSEKCTEFMSEVYLRTNECGKDALTFCPGSKKNYSNWHKCLEKRENVLSKKCLKLVKKIQRRHVLEETLPQICQQDSAKHCQYIPAEECMDVIKKLSAAELSSECNNLVQDYKSTF